MSWDAWHARWIHPCDLISLITRLVVPSPSSNNIVSISWSRIFLEIVCVSLVVAGMGGSFGVLGWLTKRILVLIRLVLVDFLSLSSRVVTVGMYDDTAKSERHIPASVRLEP